MERKDKLVVGWTDYGNVVGDFMFDFLKFMAYDAQHRGIHAGTIRAGGAYPDDNHDNATEEFLNHTTAPWFLSLDADMAPKPEQYYHLLDAADPIERPIISGLYFGYVKTNLDSGGMAPVWMKRHGSGYRTLIDSDVKSFTEGNGLIEIDSSGMGFMLIHRSVFEKMRDTHPDFRLFGWFGRQKIEHEGGILGRYGEDIAFCHRAKQCGFKIWGHTGVVIDHIKSRRENQDTFVERCLGRAALRDLKAKEEVQPNGLAAAG
jgi:hypothetical protein